MKRANLTVLVIGLLCATEARTQPQQAPTIDDIAAKWKQRQDAIKTFRIAWTQTVLYPKGGYSEGYPTSAGKGELVPTANTTFTEKGLLIVDAEKARYEFEGHAYAPHKKQFVDDSFQALYDGKTGASLRESGEAGVAIVNKQSGRRPLRLTTVDNVPILRAFRPQSAELGSPDLDVFQVSGRTENINSVACIELTLRKPAPGVSTSLWLSPSQDYHICRYHQVLATGDISLIQYDATYKHDGEHWVPSSWTHVRKSRRGQLVKSTTSVVTECVIGSPVSPATFDTTPPNNSRVNEYNKDDSLVGKYIIRPDGSRRKVVRGEESVPFASLVSTEPGEPIGKPVNSWFSRNWIVVVGVSVFVLGLVGVLFRRNLQRPVS